EQQAAAERANSQRLGQLTESGEDLVRQALRNEQFDANALERWARMIEQLQDIAERKMPSVVELLKRAAEAAGGKPVDSAELSPPKPESSQVSENKSTPSGGDAAELGDAKEAPISQAAAMSDVESGHNEIKAKD